MIEKVRQPFNLNSLAIEAALAALEDHAFVQRSLKNNQEAMRFWETGLNKLGIPFWKSQGNFILVDVQAGLGKSGGEIYLECLKKGIIFRPVTNYGLPHALRISLGTPSENEAAFEILAEQKGIAGSES